VPEEKLPTTGKARKKAAKEIFEKAENESGIFFSYSFLGEDKHLSKKIGIF
jgi:hypothetical protein